jgi:predicted transcriptional regulator
METKEKLLSILIREGEKTATELAERCNVTRQAIWKVLKNIISEGLIISRQLNTTKKSAKIFSLNFNNPLTKKALSFILTKEAMENERWVENFSELEKISNFVLLFGSILTDKTKAKDIDIIIVSEKKNLNIIHERTLEIQKVESKKIHTISLTKQEFSTEVKNKNKAYLDALKKGIILFGQDNFINQMEELNGN